VREIGAYEAEIPYDDIRAARIALTRERARSARPAKSRRRRRTWAGIGIGGLVAGAAVTAIVAGSVLAPPAVPSAAAEVLNAAAASASDPVLQPGQFLAVSTTYQYVQHWDLDAGLPAGDLADAEGSFLVDQPIVRYAPADRAAGDWIVDRKPDAVVETWGDPAAVDQWMNLWGSTGAGVARIDRYPGGIGHTGRVGVADDSYFIDGRDFYAGMPEDPAGIIDWWDARYADEQDEGGYAHFFIETVTDLGTFNLAPAEIRSAMLGAFASVEGMEVVRVDGSHTTMGFNRGTAAHPDELEFVLDTQHGYILSVTSWGRYSSSGSSTDGSPPWASRTESTVSVVDAAP
jgi:hypothetical protein